ncbi:MAG: rRNA pseudouridine synthase [Oscillospiraceae bacterium]|nr:rRNA pseudouridine synthase [Oscillospiraceae bacterium]
MRLQQYLSAYGYCSRRRAEDLIRAGRVAVNGITAVIGQSVDEKQDSVLVDGVPVAAPRDRTYIMLHKPKGYVTTLRDPQGRLAVGDLVRDAGVRLYPVGRLDYASEGLLIMTDDGSAANRLAHPSGGVQKTYRVWVRGREPAQAAQMLRSPVEYKGVRYRGAEVRILRASDRRAKLELTLSEGKNREIRNMCAAAGLTVERLVRIRQGELELGDLPAGAWRFLTPREVKYLQSL